jgi:hypothetical protein
MMDARNAGFIMIDIVKADANIQQLNPKAVKVKKAQTFLILPFLQHN